MVLDELCGYHGGEGMGSPTPPKAVGGIVCGIQTDPINDYLEEVLETVVRQRTGWLEWKEK